MHTSTLILTIIALAASTYGNPITGVNSKRSSTERVFLANCNGMPGQNSGYEVSSQMDYYATDAESRTGQIPDAQALLTSNTYISWEGNTVTGVFADGNRFVSQIEQGADSLPEFEYAGAGYNDYGAFNCYKDDGRYLFGWEAGDYYYGCMSIYYCEDA